MRNITNKSDTIKRVETKLGGNIEEILRVLYVEKELPLRDICKILDVAYMTAYTWLRRAGIRSRRIKVDF